MVSLNALEAFVRSAETKSFSEAARRLGLTPAAVSKHVARLEADLGVRLFQRSTRRLALTEAGERFLHETNGGMAAIQAAVANVARDDGQPSGTLRVSLSVAFGREYVLPYLGSFLARYPAIVPDWTFDNRPVDLVGEGFDAAIGAGFALAPGLIARELARIQLIVVASPTLMAGKRLPKDPLDLMALPAIQRRQTKSGRLLPWTLQNGAGESVDVMMTTRAILSDPEALCAAASAGVGVALVPVPHALPYLERGELVRLLPRWAVEVGALSIYFGSHKLMPPKTRAFVDFMVEAYRRDRLAKRFAAV